MEPTAQREQPEPHSFEDFEAQVNLLLSEAAKYGIQILVCLYEDNPLTQQVHISHGWRGSVYTLLGCVDRLRHTIHADMDANPDGLTS